MLWKVPRVLSTVVLVFHWCYLHLAGVTQKMMAAGVSPVPFPAGLLYAFVEAVSCSIASSRAGAVGLGHPFVFLLLASGFECVHILREYCVENMQSGPNTEWPATATVPLGVVVFR